MRSIWRGAVSFGLVSIGVKLYSATEDKDIRFHQVHAVDGGRGKYKRVCSIDGEEVEYSDIAKGFELPDGQVVILTDEDFDELPLSTRREIEWLEFVDQDERDTIQCDKTHDLCACAPPAGPGCSSCSPRTRSPRSSSRRPTTSTPTAPPPARTRCCARPWRTPAGSPSPRSPSGSASRWPCSA